MAKKTKEEATGKSKLDATLEALNKKYGTGTVLELESKIVGDYDVISSGSIGFDYITLGIGGFAKGKMYELMGWEGTGKSTICGHVTAECQRKGGKVLYIDGEHAVDKTYFQALGVDTSKLLLSQPESGEEGFIIAEEMIKTGEIDLIIIDSDSSLIPKSVVDGEIGDSSIGKKARLNNSAYPKLKSLVCQYKVCLIVISQYREKIGVMFGNPTTTQGGHALKYYTDCRIEVSRSLIKEGDVNTSNLTKLKTVKNKMFPPFRKSEFHVLYGKGIDKLGEIMLLANDLEIIKKWGVKITWGETKYTETEFREHLLVNDFYDLLKLDIINKIKTSDIEVTEEEQTETE